MPKHSVGAVELLLMVIYFLLGEGSNYTVQSFYSCPRYPNGESILTVLNASKLGCVERRDFNSFSPPL